MGENASCNTDKCAHDLFKSRVTRTRGFGWIVTHFCLAGSVVLMYFLPNQTLWGLLGQVASPQLWFLGWGNFLLFCSKDDNFDFRDRGSTWPLLQSSIPSVFSNGCLMYKIQSSTSSNVWYPCYKRLETWYFLQTGIAWEVFNFLLCVLGRGRPHCTWTFHLQSGPPWAR